MTSSQAAWVVDFPCSLRRDGQGYECETGVCLGCPSLFLHVRPPAPASLHALSHSMCLPDVTLCDLCGFHRIVRRGAFQTLSEDDLPHAHSSFEVVNPIVFLPPTVALQPSPHNSRCDPDCESGHR